MAVANGFISQHIEARIIDHLLLEVEAHRPVRQFTLLGVESHEVKCIDHFTGVGLFWR